MACLDSHLAPNSIVSIVEPYQRVAYDWVGLIIAFTFIVSVSNLTNLVSVHQEPRHCIPRQYIPSVTRHYIVDI
jgi:hypothetical protein